MTTTMTRRQWRRNRALQQRIVLVGYSVLTSCVVAAAAVFVIAVTG
ncbi:MULTISPECIES: hypothetical protein [Arthrobacter]|uniref:Uncharacterized protein n=1 Tax=Arthrobacter jinronghuae TaxID=2964609 RepID=A0ABT1NVG2_9MICC|nr:MULTISPECIES: hypothetical protein [Arthrobacter]MCQ1951102.1 hypothetical protein [Arthrobacter jinronghuae]MCQ1954413.1 hypothetical protein [Arthrobacter sp. zg-Y238]MCQ1957288.1 hypothetical protein [Arthrobacter jinronghuae]UWX79553.1 hypothetical protein N2K98_04955 [Arthrobacter jinronghuae]